MEPIKNEDKEDLKVGVQPNKKIMNQSKKSGKQGKQPRIPNSVPKKDHHQRVTYLYKLGSLMTFKKVKSELSGEKKRATDILSRVYLNHMDLVSKKSVLKMHPDIKRTVCKKCNRLLIDGLTSKTRIKNESRKKLPHCDVLEITCECGTVKRFPIGKDPEYTLFSEKDDVLHEIE